MPPLACFERLQARATPRPAPSSRQRKPGVGQLLPAERRAGHARDDTGAAASGCLDLGGQDSMAVANTRGTARRRWSGGRQPPARRRPGPGQVASIRESCQPGGPQPQLGGSPVAIDEQSGIGTARWKLGRMPPNRRGDPLPQESWATPGSALPSSCSHWGGFHRFCGRLNETLGASRGMNTDRRCHLAPSARKCRAV